MSAVSAHRLESGHPMPPANLWAQVWPFNNMKLYAKIRSERAEKGQGGNTRIEISLYGGDREQPVAILQFYEIAPGHYQLDTVALKPSSFSAEVRPVGQDCSKCERPVDNSGLPDRCIGH